MPLSFGYLKSNSSLGLRFFGSFVALFLVFLVLSNLVLFRVFVPQFEAEIQSLNDLILRSTQIALDERVFRSIEAEYVEVTLNRAGHDFYYPITNDPLENLWRPVESIVALRERVGAADFEPHAISIFFPRWRYVLSSQGFKAIGRSSSILEFSWSQDLLDGSRSPRSRWQRGDSVVDYNVTPHVYAEMLRFVGPYPPAAATSEPLAYVVIETPMTSVETIVARYADFSPGVFWIARDGREVLFSNRPLSSAREVSNDPAYVYSSIPSEVPGLSYHYAIPRDVLFERATNVRNGLYYTVIITVLLSLVVSWLIARYLGRPIAQIARTAERVSKQLHLESQKPGANDLVRIETTIEGLAKRIERNAPMVQEKFFADLLNGVIGRDEIDRRITAMSLGNLPPIIQVGILVQRTATTTASEDARLQIMHLLPQITTDFVLFYFPVDHERLVLIAAANDEDEFTEFCHDLHDRLWSLRRGTSTPSIGRGRLVLSLGPPVASLADIAASYDVAKRRLPFYFVSGNPILVPIERDDSESPPVVEMPTDDQIGEVLATEDPQTIGDFLEGVRDSLRESDEDIYSLNQKVCALATRIRRFISPSARGGGSIAESVLDCDFSHFDTLGELFSSWRDDIAAYFAELLDGRHDNNSNLVKRARAYLDEHFVDDVSLSALAERYEVSYSHLSKLFHDYSGLTFREYLLTLRLEKAAELLLSTDLPVKRVAYESGFRDTGYFIRQFKRKHGLTPVNYRKRGGGSEPG